MLINGILLPTNMEDRNVTTSFFSLLWRQQRQQITKQRCQYMSDGGFERTHSHETYTIQMKLFHDFSVYFYILLEISSN